MMLTVSIIILVLYSMVGLRMFRITSFHDIDVFRYLTFKIYLQLMPVSHATVVY